MRTACAMSRGILHPLHGGDGGAVRRLSRRVENTQRIADRCQFDFTFGKYHLPEFQLPPGYDSFTYLKELCDAGYRERYGMMTRTASSCNTSRT